MKVVYFFRKPYDSHYSIENVFNTVIKSLPNDIRAEKIVLPFKSRGFFPRIFNMIYACLHQGDINHITGDIHYIALFLHKKRTVLTIHDCAFASQNISPIAKKLIKIFWYTIPIARSRIVTVISHKTKKDVIEITQCAPAKITIIPNPLDDRFEYKYKKFAKTPILLQIGTKPNKNLSRVIEAIKVIKCQFIIIGPLDSAIKNKLDKYNIKYFSYKNLSDKDMVKMYSRSDTVIFASTYEGFGMPIIEANAVGRPVITSNIAPMKDIAGQAACLVDPYKISSIRQGIAKVINNSKYRTKLIQLGRLNAKKYNSKTITDQYVDLYHHL